MHLKGLTGKKLAELTGFTPEYISIVLNGHKGNERTRKKIEAAVGHYSQDSDGGAGQEGA